MVEYQLYDKIYEVASTQMQLHGMKFSFSREAFDSILYKDPNKVCVDEFLQMAPKEFLEAVYLRCLNRLPNALAYKQVDDAGKSLELVLWKYLLLMYVSRSVEFQGLDKELEGLAELRRELLRTGSWKVKYLIISAEIKADVKYVVKKYILFPIWKRMPDNVKCRVREFLLRERK